jgi:hypothetical protein
VAGLYWWNVSKSDTVAELLTRMPEGDVPVLYVDLAALRDSDLLELLAGAGVDEEPDYRRFVEETGFDYREDLDSVLAGFYPSETFVIASGRFRWGRLNHYVKRLRGYCLNGLCRADGSLPDRRISFEAITYKTMALASSRDRSAVLALRFPSRPPGEWIVPKEPVWLSVPARTLLNWKWLPVGTQSFARALSEKDRVVFSLGQASENYELKAIVGCGSAAEAAALAAELQRVTDLLRSLIRRQDQKPNEHDLSGLLSSGVFEHSGFTVVGRWPVTRPFLEALASGGTEEQRESEEPE